MIPRGFFRIQARVRQGPPALVAVTGGYRHGRLHPNKHDILCTVQEFNGHDPAARRAWSIASKHDSVKTEQRGLSDAQASSMARSMASKHESRGLDAAVEAEADVAPLRQPCCMPARLECLLSGTPRVPAIRRDC